MDQTHSVETMEVKLEPSIVNAHCDDDMFDDGETLSTDQSDHNFINFDLLTPTMNLLETSMDEKPHQCDVCQKSFKRKSHLQRHYRMHTGEKPYPCHVCGEQFSRSENRNRHVYEQHQRTDNHVKCEICGKALRSEQRRIAHMEWHAMSDATKQRNFPCTICGNEYEQPSHLANHMKTHAVASEKPPIAKPLFQCEFCGKKFSRRDHMLRHQTTHTGIKMFQCNLCQKRFSRADNMIKHQNNCTVKFVDKKLGEMAEQNGLSNVNECDDPLAIINDGSPLERDFADIESTTEDGDIFESIDNGDITKALKVELSNGNDQDEIKLKIKTNYPKLLRTAADEDLLRLGGYRQKVHRPKLTQEELATLQCNVCSKKLAQKYHLMRHKLIHLDEKPYKCNLCEKTFARREHLKHHLYAHKKYALKAKKKMGAFQLNANAINPVAASAVYKKEPTTESSTSSASNESSVRQQLLENFRNFAMKIKNENTKGDSGEGDFYERCFNYVSDLIMSNIQSMTTDASTKIESSVFESPKVAPELPAVNPTLMLPKVEQSIETPSAKKYPCVDCGKIFPNIHQLMRHSTVHSGEKRYSCEVCKRSFTRLEHKKRHMLIHSKDRYIECEMCDKRFSRTDHMLTHFKAHHVGIKPYRCDNFCGERFDTYKEKMSHARFCELAQRMETFMNNAASIEVNDDTSRVLDPVIHELFGNPPAHAAPIEMHTHFIKTECEVPDPDENNFENVIGC